MFLFEIVLGSSKQAAKVPLLHQAYQADKGKGAQHKQNWHKLVVSALKLLTKSGSRRLPENCHARRHVGTRVSEAVLYLHLLSEHFLTSQFSQHHWRGLLTTAGNLSHQ